MSRSNKCLKICVQAFIVLAAVAAMAAADNAPRYGYAPAPAPYAPAPAPYAPAPYKEPAYDEPAVYAYNYAVDDYNGVKINAGKHFICRLGNRHVISRFRESTHISFTQKCLMPCLRKSSCNTLFSRKFL